MFVESDYIVIAVQLDHCSNSNSAGHYCGKKYSRNTPGPRGWSRLRDRTLAVAKNHAKITFFSGGGKNYLKKYIFFAHIF